MVRIKNKNRKHKKIINLCKGYINRRSNVFKISKESIYKSLSYSYISRKNKKRIFKRFWIFYINFYLKFYNINYNLFINKLNNIVFLNKKILFNLLINNNKIFLYLFILINFY